MAQFVKKIKPKRISFQSATSDLEKVYNTTKFRSYVEKATGLKFKEKDDKLLWYTYGK
jgi:hypothetical protein